METAARNRASIATLNFVTPYESGSHGNNGLTSPLRKIATKTLAKHSSTAAVGGGGGGGGGEKGIHEALGGVKKRTLMGNTSIRSVGPPRHQPPPPPTAAAAVGGGGGVISNLYTIQGSPDSESLSELYEHHDTPPHTNIHVHQQVSRLKNGASTLGERANRGGSRRCSESSVIDYGSESGYEYRETEFQSGNGEEEEEEVELCYTYTMENGFENLS
jgi:hypothetical protein